MAEQTIINYIIEIKATVNDRERHCSAIVPPEEKDNYLKFVRKRKQKSYPGPCYKIAITPVYE